MNAPATTWFGDEEPTDIRRWAIIGAVVVLLHVLVLCPYAYFYHPEEIGDNSMPISLDLSPSEDTVDQSALLPTPEQPPEAVVQPPPPPEPEQAIEAPPPQPAPAVVQEQQQAQESRTKGAAPHVEPTWLTAVYRRLLQFKRAPAKSIEGTVELGFTLDRTGHVLSHEIEKSSGHRELDAEASSMVERAQPLPPFPNSMTQDSVDLVVPITFSLPH